MKKILFGFFVVGISILASYVFIYPKYQNLLSVPIGNETKSEIPETLPSTTPFSLKEAPTQSLKGSLKIINSDVLWQDRIATESSKIIENISVQQGEKIETNESGEVSIEFMNTLNLLVFPNSSLNIVQTLPINLVFALEKGGVKLEKVGQSTVSLRVKHLLANIDGTAEFELNAEKPIIKITVISGSVTLAYNNLNFETQLVKINEGEIIEFNDSTRKVVVR